MAGNATCHCGHVVEPRDPDPWEGRMDDYCYDCATNRCDCYPDECPVKYPQASSAASSSELVATRDRLVAERDSLAEAMRLLDLAIGGHTRGCDAPDDPDCPRCVWDSEWSRYREVRDA